MCFAKMDFRLGVKQDATMSKAILILTLVYVVIFCGYFVSNSKINSVNVFG